MLNKFNSTHIAFNNIAIHENDGWVCNMYCSTLFHVDMTTLKLTLEAVLPSENECGFAQYGPVAYYKDKLIIAPVCAKDIIVYDLYTKTIERQIGIDGTRMSLDDYLFWEIIVYKDTAFCMPGKGKCIVKINLQTFELEYLGDWYKDVRKVIANDRRMIFADVFDLGNGIVWLPCWQNNMLMEFNMDNDQYTIHMIPMIQALSSITVADDNVLLLERESATVILYTWDSECDRRKIQYQGFISSRGFRKAQLYGEYIYLFPLHANMILRYNLNTKDVQCVKILPKYGGENTNFIMSVYDNMRCCKKINEEEIIYYSIPDSKIVKLNMRTGFVLEVYAGINKEEQEFLKNKFLDKSYAEGNNENKSLALSNLIEYVQGIHNLGSLDLNTKYSSCGKSIYCYLNY